MNKPNLVQFYIEKAEDGGYVATSLGYSIHTEGDTLDETISNIREAVLCHFGEAGNVVSGSVPIVVNFAVPEMV